MTKEERIRKAYNIDKVKRQSFSAHGRETQKARRQPTFEDFEREQDYFERAIR